MPASALPAHLRDQRHKDWPWPFSRIPRAWTAYRWGVPALCYGNQRDISPGKDVDGVVRFGPAPIGEPGSWQVSDYPRAPWWTCLLPAATVLALAWLPGWWRLAALPTLPFQPFYFAVTTRRGRHFRLGARWDDVDDYVESPSVATKPPPQL